jgi:hypothetical protein
MAKKIPASKAVVLPPQPERAYDEWVYESVSLQGTGVNNDLIRAEVRWRKARTLPGDGMELGPPDAVALLQEGNVQALAVQYPKLRAALDSMKEAVEEIARDRGLL